MKLNNNQQQVIDIIKEYSEKNGVTNAEIGDILDWPRESVTPRVSELRQKKLIHGDFHRECLVSGRRVIAWKHGKGLR